MPFRLTNVLATCQALINNTLCKYLDLFYVAYLNDILIYLKNREEHVKHVKLVFKALKSKDLKLKLEKCNFFKIEIEFLGYIVTMEGLKIDSKKVKDVVE